MSSSKHIDIICVVVLVLTLIITVLFMNGEKLGITPVKNGDEESGYFTENDLNADWDTANATQITLTGDGGTVTGDGAYIIDGNVHIAYAGNYVVSGELTDGSIIIEASNSDKIWILLNGVSLNCNDNAAIIVNKAEKVFLTLADTTENTISTGAEYTKEALSLGIDGAIYSKDDLTINGSGTLNVTAEYKHGIVCNDDLVIVGANIDITAAQDGIHANDSARFAEVNLTVNAGDDGITVSNDDETSYIYIESGNITIPSCYEGIESIDVTIAGGTINITSTDDGINAKGRGSNSVIRITGGDITIMNPTGRDADGLDSNGDIYITGGRLFISVNGNGTNCAIDYGSENGGICEINGGTVIAAGSSMMLEYPASSSKQGFIVYNSTTASAETAIALESLEGTVLLSETIPYSFSAVILSAPELKTGDICTLSIGDVKTEITVDNSSASNGMGNGGMFGGGKKDKFPNGESDFGNIPNEDSRPENVPDIPNGGMPNGGMPSGEAPNGEIPNGGMPNDGIPNGDIPNGDIPNGGIPGGDMPNGQNPWGNDDLPQNGFGPNGDFQGGDFNNGDLPDMPNGGGFSGMQPPNDMNGASPFDGAQAQDGGEGQQNENESQQNSDSQDSSSGDFQRPDKGNGQNGMGGNRGDDDRNMQFGQKGEQNQESSPSKSSGVSPSTFILIGISALLLLAGILIAIKVKH